MLHRKSFSGASSISRGRSSTLRRAGTSVSAEPASSPLGSSGGLQDSAALLPGVGSASGSLPWGAADSPVSPAGTEPAPVEPVATPVPQEVQEPCGLTPASLKHLKRKHEALVEEKARLQSEITGLQAQTREQRQQLSVMEEQVREAEARQAALEAEGRRAREAEQEQRGRAAELERANSQLEERLTAREAEIARLREALEQQRRLTREVCEASEQRTQEPPDTREFEQRIRQLEGERDALQQQLRQQAAEHDDMKRSVAGAMAAAEKAMAMHAFHLQHTEQLRAAKLMEAINNKVELHISVPRVTLSYNNAPPLVVSVAHGLSDGRIRDFLDNDVFPHFEPLWVRMDSLDKAPDGSSKRAYSTKMLERLTDAVKAFIVKSQTAEAGADLRLSSGGQSPRAGGGESGKVGRGAGGGGGHDTARRADASGASGGSSGGQNGLSDADRHKLLHLLRSGDDRGLDSKLVQLLEGRP